MRTYTVPVTALACLSLLSLVGGCAIAGTDSADPNMGEAEGAIGPGAAGKNGNGPAGSGGTGAVGSGGTGAAGSGATEGAGDCVWPGKSGEHTQAGEHTPQCPAQPPCKTGDTQCSGAVYQVCESIGTWSAGTVTVGQCGAVCVPGESRCSGAVEEICDASGQWQRGRATAGICGAACSEGDRTTCAAVYGAQGVCATGVVTCEAGRWSACSIAPQAELCNPDSLDENCNGNAFDGCECTNGDEQGCGGCNTGMQECEWGHWGACVGGTPNPTTVCIAEDQDGDEHCLSTLECACASAGTASWKPGWRPVGECIDTSGDCLDTNAFVADNCHDFGVVGGWYDKVWYPNETISFAFDCGPGYHALDCRAVRTDGTSKYFWVTSYSAGAQAGTCDLYFGMDGLEGVSGYGVVTCHPVGLDPDIASIPVIPKY